MFWNVNSKSYPADSALTYITLPPDPAHGCTFVRAERVKGGSIAFWNKTLKLLGHVIARHSNLAQLHFPV